MGGRINTVMQTCFFAISGVLPAREAIEAIKDSDSQNLREKGRRDRGDESEGGRSNARAFIRSESSETRSAGRVSVRQAQRRPEATHRSLCAMCSAKSSPVAAIALPVSALPNDGTYPTGTTQFEKRNLATEVPVWDPQVCIQCGKCVFVCPHAVIRSKAYDAAVLAGAPSSFKSHGGAAAGMERAEIHAAGRGGRLHRLRHLRRCLPGAQQIRSATESHQHAAAGAAA